MTEQRHTFVPYQKNYTVHRFMWGECEWSIASDAGESGEFAFPRDDPESHVKWTWDPLRSGWHITRKGARYVAVQGVKAGQRIRCFGNTDASKAYATMDARACNHNANGLHWESSKYDGADAWCVLDLHDLKDHRTQVATTTWEDIRETPTSKTPREMVGDADRCPLCKGSGTKSCLVCKGSGRCTSELTNVEFTPDPPRFQVKPAASMREGEPIVWSLTLDRGEGGNDRTAAEVIRDKQRALEAANYGQEWKADIPEHAASHARFIIDTHSPDWQAFDAKHRRDAAWDHMAKACTPAPPLVLPEIAKPQRHRWQKNEQRNCMECQCGAWAYTALSAFPDVACELAWKLYEERAKPQGPADAEIVEAWDTAMREHEGGRPGPWSMSTEWNGRRIAAVFIGPKATAVRTTRDQFQAARSRELQKRAAESREKDRQRVVCEGTLAEDY